MKEKSELRKIENIFHRRHVKIDADSRRTHESMTVEEEEFEFEGVTVKEEEVDWENEEI